MAISPWVRLWLPLGNTFLLVAILDTTDMLRNELKDVAIFLAQGMSQYSDAILAFYSIPEVTFMTASTAIRLIITIGFLWIGAILMGNKTSLLVWIISTIVLNIAAVGVTIFMLFTLSPSIMDTLTYWRIVYSLFLCFALNGFVLFIACVSYRALGRQELLHPIGKGAAFIWEYFSNETKTAATFFLTTEIVLDSYNTLSRQFIQLLGGQFLGHDNDKYTPIVVEEIVLRVIRIILNSYGLWLVAKEQRRPLRWWCGLTFLLILVSTVIFIVLTVLWRGEDIVSTLAYFLLFPGHLLFRFLTLYFCLKYTRADFSRFVL